MRPRRIKLILGCLILPLAFYFLSKSPNCHLAVPRFGHTATLLKDGRILVSGGFWVPNQSPYYLGLLQRLSTIPWLGDRLSSYLQAEGHCEILDTRTWHWHVCATAEDYAGAGSALLLNDGRVLRQVQNILSYSGVDMATPQIFDPVHETWCRALPVPRSAPHRRWLVMADATPCYIGAYALWVDPETAQWQAILSGGIRPKSAWSVSGGITLRTSGWSVQLDDRSALFEGQKYDVPTDTWTPTGPFHTGHSDGRALMLPDGRVLVCGGTDSKLGIVNSAELYDPKTNTWSITGSMHVPREYGTCTMLPNGTVLAVGGDSGRGHAEASCEIYHPSTGQWTLTGSLNLARLGHTATLLPSGKVLVIGGTETGQVFGSCELYDPVTGSWTEL